MKKSIKIDEKEVHDLKIRFTNLQDANANLKAELSSSNLLKKKAERKVRKLKQKIEVKKIKETVSVQTISSLDIPEPSPPFFIPQLSLKTQPGYFSHSMPNIYHKDGLDEKVKCNICGLTFVTTSELDDHDNLYKFCCRMCCTCYKTVQESELCCLDADKCWTNVND